MSNNKVNFLKTFATNKESEEKGIELIFGDAKFIVKRAGASNKPFTLSMSNFYKKNKFQLENQLLSEEKLRPELAKIYFRHISLGWEGVEDPETDLKLEHNEENFVRIMTEFPEFFETYRDQCSNRANFQREELESEAKN